MSHTSEMSHPFRAHGTVGTKSGNRRARYFGALIVLFDDHQQLWQIFTLLGVN